MDVSGVGATAFRSFINLLFAGVMLCASLYGAEEPSSNLTFKFYRDCDAATQALVNEVVNAAGGPDSFARARSIRRIARIEQSTAEGVIPLNLDGIAIFPRSYHARIESPVRTLRVVITPDDAYVVGREATVPAAALRLNENEREAFLQYFYCLPQVVLRDRNRSDVVFASAGAVAGDRPLAVLATSVTGLEVRWYLDRARGRIVKVTFGDEETELDDWRDVAGLLLPFTERHRRGGELAGVVKVARYEVNAPMEENALFMHPPTWLSRTAYTFRADAPQMIGQKTPASSYGRDSQESQNRAGRSMSYSGSTFTVYDTPLGVVWLDFFAGSPLR